MLYNININGRGVTEYDWSKDRDKVYKIFSDLLQKAQSNPETIVIISNRQYVFTAVKHGIATMVEMVTA